MSWPLLWINVGWRTGQDLGLRRMWCASLRVPGAARVPCEEAARKCPLLSQVLSDSSYPLGANLGPKKAEAGAWAQRGSRTLGRNKKASCLVLLHVSSEER